MDAIVSILVAAIPSLLTFAGVVVSNHSANKKMANQVKKLEEHQEENRKANKATAEKVEKVSGQMSALTTQVEEMKSHQKENYLGILRLEIMNEEMPVPERIIAGEEYIKNGGNGEVKKYYHAFLKEHTK